MQARKWEQARIKRQQARLAAQEKEFRQNGTVTPLEDSKEIEEITANGKAKKM